jgi:predicted nuclease of predicted toxin-antitoxin system
VNHLDRIEEVYVDSNWGPDISVVAPGGGIMSCARSSNTAYIEYDGTSMAAPHVTGLVGYMLTFAPDLRPDQIKTYIEQNADPIDGQKGHSNRSGWGRINTYRTIGKVIDDQTAGRTPASDYVLAPVKVTVKDAAGRGVNGAKVWLHNCDENGVIDNYAGVQMTGPSLVDLRDDPTAAPEDGVTRFSMLKPGHYKAVAIMDLIDIDKNEFGTHAAASSKFTVGSGATVPPITLSLDVEAFFIQTCPTSNMSRQNTDTTIMLYNSVAGSSIISWDSDIFDTVPMVMPKTPGTYWIRIGVWNNSNSYTGEYALWLGSPTKPEPAPGTFANPGEDGTKGGLTTTRSADSQLVEINSKVVYGDIATANRTSGDYYRFVIPEPAP